MVTRNAADGAVAYLLTETRAAVLQALCTPFAGQSPDIGKVLWHISPPPARRDARTREHKAWAARQLELTRAICDLTLMGLVEWVETPPGESIAIRLAEPGAAT